MPGRTSRTVVHIIRAATYDGQGVETDLWESDLAPPRKQGGRNTHRTPKGTAPPPDPTVIRSRRGAPDKREVARSAMAVSKQPGNGFPLSLPLQHADVKRDSRSRAGQSAAAGGRAKR